VIFFNRPKDGSITDKVWYYELTNDGFELKQTRKPKEGSQIPEFLAKWEHHDEGENSWLVSLEEIIENGYELTAKNPNSVESREDRSALDLVQSIKAKEERIMDLLGELELLLEDDQ
jgi:type I restriction enzyme M protein